MFKDFNIGMQVHAHDLKFEGSDTVIDYMQNMGGVKTAYLMCNYFKDRHPMGKGELPHNPVRKVFHTNGGLYFDPHLECYKKSVLKPQRTPDLDLKDFDALRAITLSAKENDMRVLAWILTLTDSLIADKYRKYSMVDVYGKNVYGWLCPSYFEVRSYVLSLIEDITSNYSVEGIFFDMFRFPESRVMVKADHKNQSLGFDAAFTCFCKECVKRAKRNGINLSKTRKTIKRLADSVKENRFPQIISKFLKYRKGCLDLAKILVDMPEIGEWITHRQDIITDFVTEAYKSIKEMNPKLEFSLDLWPPSYSWLLGQNYQRLKKHCNSLKYFTYHKMGGGVDLKAVVQELQTLNPDLDVSQFLDLFYRFFGFKGPNNLDELREKGLTVEFILEETLKALDETKREVRVYPGIQIFDVTSEEVKEAVGKSFEASIDGIIAFCYGWATLENIKTFGDTLKELNVKS